MIGQFGVREICNVMFKAVSENQKVGNKIFAKGEPVVHFDSLKTTSFEQATTTVYAQGGRGNSRLIAWEGEKTLTFTMEDALLSPMGLALLSGAGLLESGASKTAYVHCTEFVDLSGAYTSGSDNSFESLTKTPSTSYPIYLLGADSAQELTGQTYKIETSSSTSTAYLGTSNTITVPSTATVALSSDTACALVDYYTAETTSGKVTELTIEPDNFGGYFYVEGSCLFRQEKDGKDFPAELVMPKVKVQSNFTFSMASSGDPSTFTFTCDAFPGVVQTVEGKKKVLADIQIIDDSLGE